MDRMNANVVNSIAAFVLTVMVNLSKSEMGAADALMLWALLFIAFSLWDTNRELHK